MTLIFHSKDADRKFTIVIAYENGYEKALCGLAICNKKDQFTKKLGVGIASGRAIRHPFKIIDVDLNLTEQEAKKFLLEKGYEIVEEVKQHLPKMISGKYQA